LTALPHHFAEGDLMRSLSVAILALCLTPCAFGDYFTTSIAPGEKTFNFSGGESQSTVVPPGKKSQCPNGRFVVTDNWRRPPLVPLDSFQPPGHPEVKTITEDVVHWRNLPGSKNAPIPHTGVSTFKVPPNVVEQHGGLQLSRPHRWGIWWSDHRLVTTLDGDLIYQRIGATREPMSPEPPWAPKTFRALGTGFFGPKQAMQFGPGARSTNITWRSTDCGATFEYLGEIDSYGAGYEECASPQRLNGSNLPNFNMGGTDNPNLIVDRKEGTVYALVPCFGRHLKPGVLELAGGVEKTYVFSWNPKKRIDKKNLFVNRGSYSPTYWGAPAVPLSPTRMAVAANAGVKIGTAASASAKFSFPDLFDTTGDVWGWDNWDSPSDPELLKRIGGGIQGSTVLANMPGDPGSLLLAFPAKIGSANGFKVYAYDPDLPESERFTPLDDFDIVPTGAPESSSVIHLTAVDPGSGGPVLLYWTDLTGGTVLKGRVHGRVIYNKDSSVEVDDITPVPFDLTPPATGAKPYFYGDYRTAEVFETAGPSGTTVYRYYPMWVQPWTTPKNDEDQGGSVHYREVTVTRTKFIGKVVAEVPLHDKPFEQVFGECCDFVPLIRRIEREQGLTTFDRAGKPAEQSARLGMVEALLQADPNLRLSRLRMNARKSPPRQARRAIPAPAPLAPRMRKSFEEHGEQPPGARPAPRP
jgi:hypothetical protein